nr:MAG TPA: hypothetical protein [Caudoviricetes sp.]
MFGYYRNPATYSPIRQGNRYLKCSSLVVMVDLNHPRAFTLYP